MTNRPTNTLKTEQLDMESFFDFNAGTQPSPVTASSSKTDAMSPFDTEDRQQFNGPSHDYSQFKQQVGLPGGSMANMPMSQSNGMFDGFNSGFGDMDFNGSGMGWNSGLDMDADMTMDFNSSMMFYPGSSDNQSDKFVNPSNVAGHNEPTSSVGRLWPGMHSQQAQQVAMAKAAQIHDVQQRQMKLAAQQAQYRQASQSSQSSSQGSSQQSHANAKRGSHIAEPHVEESISRLLNQMRQNNSQDDSSSPNGIPSQIARLKKDEDDMDEDERLLASEEGKKLSSKERRQLRNKVSARAFRSRRKEYISQLEGEVNLKTQEANSLRNDNQALVQENERYRGLIECLLRHPAFTPFINDISKDPSMLGLPQQMPQSRQQVQRSQSQLHQQSQNSPQEQHQQPQQQQPQQQSQQQQQQQQEVKPDFMNFDPSQIQIPQQGEQVQVGMTMVPDNDFSKLNLNGFKSMNFNNFNVQSAYAVTHIPAGPDPVDLLLSSPTRPLRSTNASSTVCSSDSSLNLLLAKLDLTASRIKDGLMNCDN